MPTINSINCKTFYFTCPRNHFTRNIINCDYKSQTCTTARRPYIEYSSVVKVKIHYTSFPVASPQHKRQVCDKSVTSWRGQKSVVYVVSCRLPNSITTTCCGLVGRVANKSVTSGSFPLYRKLPGNVCNGFWALV